MFEINEIFNFQKKKIIIIKEREREKKTRFDKIVNHRLPFMLCKQANTKVYKVREL